MSGHSKWSKVKHQKETADAAKGKAFTKVSRMLTVAVGEGGGLTDPAKNFRLRLALEKAREVNMPKETIERAIERGKGTSGQIVESILYEAYGPAGTAILIEAATDNRARTVSEVKHVLERFGATLCAPGSVSFLFDRMGVVEVPKRGVSLDRMTEIALVAGADDVGETGETFKLSARADILMTVKETLEEQGIETIRSALVFRPKTRVQTQPETGQKVRDLIRALGQLDDVQAVWTNLEGEGVP